MATVGLDVRAVYQRLSAWSLEAAAREQELGALRESLRQAVPDIADQYSRPFPADEYERFWEPKMRGLHAFQMKLTLDAIRHIGRPHLVVADIGDSSGTHARYLKVLSVDVSRVVSVNLDARAVERIRRKGGEAIHCRAEQLSVEGLDVDLFLSFETVEHLTDPVRFLHQLATSGTADVLVMTVPYRKVSRFGAGEIRTPDWQLPERMTAEDLHVFEFSPADWLLLARFAGWREIVSRVYWQYPRRSVLRVMAPLWRGLDYEGFFGVALGRDLTFASRYVDW